MAFDATTPPSVQDLEKAAALKVYTESGEQVAFGELFKDQKTITVFIRHFFCGLCQEFISYLTAKLKAEDLAAANVKLVVIGCGEWGLIKGYRELLNTPFEIYADPTKDVYTALGMTLRTLDGATAKAEYVNTSLIGNTVSSIANAFKMGPFKKSGDIKQLGGEFVLGPGPVVSYTHRMVNTKGHAPLSDITAAAGINPAVAAATPAASATPASEV